MVPFKTPSGQRRLTLEEAQQIMAEATSLMQDREYEVASLPVLNLVAASTHSAYDCEFATLAQELGVPLLTVERQVLGQFPTVALALDTFVGS